MPAVVAVVLAAAAAPAFAVDDPPTVSADDALVSLEVLGPHSSGQFDESAAEIIAFDPGTDRAYVVNANSGRLDVLDAADPTAPTLETSISASGTASGDGSTVPDGAVANSVAVRGDGLVVVAVESDVKTDAGWLVLVDGTTLERLGAVRVGSQPDMVILTPDGSRAVVANEGEPSDDFSVDPEGSVSVVALPSVAAVPAQTAVATATFHAFEDGGSSTLPDGVRVFGPEVNVVLPGVGEPGAGVHRSGRGRHHRLRDIAGEQRLRGRQSCDRHRVRSAAARRQGSLRGRAGARPVRS
jgi:hypothetical protein